MTRNVPGTLEGARWNVLGDSLTEINFQSTKFYHEFVKEWAGIAEVRNYGISGSTISNKNKPMSTRYLEMPDDVDIVTVLGGCNDFGMNVEIGTFSDRKADTFYGACHVLFSGLIAKYPKQRIGYITSHYQTDFFPQQNDHQYEFEDYVNAAIETARYYGIPVLDLYHEGGICVRVDAHKTLYTTDGLHLNAAGHEWIARKIHNFLLTL